MVESTNDNRGQRAHTCDIVGCNEKGRMLAKLGNMPIYYCPKHRKKYGERIINALINSIFNFKLSNFLTEIKKDIFMSDDFLSEESYKKIHDYIIEKTVELDNILEYAEKNEIDGTIEELK